MGTTIAVVGPGAIGSTVAALVHSAGHQVVVCGRTPRDCIEVRSDDGNSFVVPGPVHTDPETTDGPVDVVILAVKDTQTEGAAGWLARLCGENTVVCALQNGVEQVDRVGRFCPSSTVVPAAVWLSAETQPEGWVRGCAPRGGWCCPMTRPRGALPKPCAVRACSSTPIPTSSPPPGTSC